MSFALAYLVINPVLVIGRVVVEYGETGAALHQLGVIIEAGFHRLINPEGIRLHSVDALLIVKAKEPEFGCV